MATANDYHVVTVDVGKAQPEGFALNHEYHKDAIDRSTAKGSVSEWLYGYNDPSTGTWKQGELTKAMQEVVSGETSKKEGIKLLHLKAARFDFYMLEPLHPLLDDNRTFVAPGFTCKLPKDVRVVIESQGCAVQSPQNVTRCGFVFFTFK